MRILLFFLFALTGLPMLGCEQPVSLTLLDQTAADIFDDTITVDDSGKCSIDVRNNAIDNAGYVTTQPDGSKLILFRTWPGKGTNLRGILYTNGPPLTLGSEIEVVTFQPTGPTGGPSIGRADVSIDSSITESCYRVSRSLD